MELTTKQKNSSAQFFIQQFPLMTFERAKTVFNTLKKPVQTAVWNKLEEHKELSSALGLAHLLPELQSLILTRTDKPSKELEKKLNKDTILALFIRKAEVDQQCGNKNYLEIRFNAIDSPAYKEYDRPKINISLTKQELLSITNDHIKVIEKVQRKRLAKTELNLLNELSPDLLDKLKPHYNFDKDGRSLWWIGGTDGDDISNKNREIKFYYREGKLTTGQKSIRMAKDGFNCCKEVLPYIIPSLLYIHFVIGPTWSTLTMTQDPDLLQQNTEFKITNKLIDSLKELNIDGSKHLSKCIIEPVPFKYSNRSIGKILATLLPIISSATLKYSSLIDDDDAFRVITRNCLIVLISVMIVDSIKDYIWIDLKDIGNLCQSMFSAGIPTTLALISGFVGLAGIIKGRIDAYTWKKHSIDFTKGESVAQFLNDSSIEIREYINE